MTFNPAPKKPFKRRKPKLSQRGKFSDATIAKIIDRDNGLCVICFAPANDIHHVRFKSHGGRGVYTNGVCICRHCHDDAHNHGKVAKRLQDMMIARYGHDYFRDRWDLE